MDDDSIRYPDLYGDTLDQIRCRQDDEYYRTEHPPLEPFEVGEQRIRAQQRALVAEVHAKPWLYGHEPERAITRARREHTQSIARSISWAKPTRYIG